MTSCLPSISVIIPVYNGGEKFQKCLQSLTASKYMPKEVIIVSDGCSDSSWALAENYGATVIRKKNTAGPAHARNIGAKRASGDILFFFDADVSISEDAIGLVASTFRDNHDIAAVFGSYDDEPFESNFLSQYKNLFHHYMHQRAKEDASTFWSGCGAIRREIFVKLGGFDEKYIRPAIEDIELGYRMKTAGYQIRLLKHLQVKHLKRWTILSLLKADFLYRALPWTDLILSHGSFIDDMNIKLSERLNVAIFFAILVMLIASLWNSWLFIIALLGLMVLIVTNWKLYSFYLKNRGWAFTLKIIPWHWLYFLYSGLAFAFANIKYQMRSIFF